MIVTDFFKSKALICFCIFVTLYFLMHTHNTRLLQQITTMNQLNNSVHSRNLVGHFDIVDAVCLVVFSIYGLISFRYVIEAFKFANEQYKKMKSKKSFNLYNLIYSESEFEHVEAGSAASRFVTVAIFMVSVTLLALLFMPPNDEMLQFIDESGLINVYLLVVSFLLGPVQENDYLQYEAEIEAFQMQARLYQAQLKALAASQDSPTG